MTPLEFFISVKNSEAKNGLEEFRQQVQQFKQDAGEIYEGPARESKFRTEVAGLIKDVSLGKDPLYVFISAMERLSEVFRLAIPAAVALAVGFGLQTQLRAAATSATEFFDLFAKGMGTSVKDASEDALKTLVKNMDDLEDKYAKRGFFEKLFYGGYENKMMAGARDLATDAKARIDELEAARIEAHTNSLRSMTDQELAMQGEIDAVTADLMQKAAKEREQGHEQAAEAYEAQISVAIDRIKDKEKKADEERFAKRQELVDRLNEANDEANQGGLSPMEKEQALYLKRAQLMAWISDNLAQSPLIDKDDGRLKAQIQVAQLTKEINEIAAERKKTAADAEKEAAEKSLEATDKTTRLRQEAAKAEYENLSREEKLAVLRTEQATLQRELSRSVYSGDARMSMQKDLADVRKALADLSKDTYIWRGISAETALTGSMSSSTFGRVTNDPANRAEKQRDQMVTLLTKIAGGAGGLSADKLDLF